jgi:large subunit ribosomal protein L3
MTQIRLRDNSESATKGQIISVPVTILECPPLKPLSLRFYKQTDDGLKLFSEISTSQETNKELSRKTNLSKKKKQERVKGTVSILPDKYDKVTLQVYTQPKLVSLKKKPEIFEIAFSKDVTPEFLKESLEKEIKASDVFKEGQFVDAVAVTIGKGFQGPVKRFGVSLRAKKSEKTKRGAGSLGPWNQQQHTMYRIAHAGQTGYHIRTEYNKLLLKISSKPEEINPVEGIQKYGLVKLDYLLLQGSIAGPKKRLIRLREPVRANSPGLTQEVIQ